MINNSIPSASQIAGTVDFLTVLEMASDPKKVKAALAEIKDAQDKLADQGVAVAKQIGEIEKATKKLANQENAAMAAHAKAEISISNSTKAIADAMQASEDLEALRRDIGNKQGELDLGKKEFEAYISRKESDFARREGLMAEAESGVARAAAKAQSDAKAADDLRLIYEGKLAKLQALAS